MQEYKLKVGYDLLYLISCALHDKVPQKCYVEKMNLEKVYALAKYHTMQAMAFHPLDRYSKENNCPLDLEDSKIQSWRIIRQKILQKDLMLDLERGKLFDFFEEKGIGYLPMKGLVLHKLYPKMGWRFLSDNDILFDKTYRREVRDYFKGQGYRVGSYKKNVHDVYYKKPFLYFEMHVAFFAPHNEDPGVQRVAEHFRDPWKWTKRDGDGFSHHLSDEDFYLHSIIAHAYKHTRNGGTGLRTLTDIYVYLTHKRELDWDYIASHLEQLQLTEFEKSIKELAFCLFESGEYPSELTDAQQELLMFFGTSGAYGSLSTNIATKITNVSGGEITFWGKARYVIRRIFPDSFYYREYEPFFYKYKILIPFFWVWRVFRSIFIKGSAAKEIKSLKKIKTDKQA